MSLFVDLKYLRLISSQLPLFKQKNNNLYNCRCIICGDSSTKKNRARGYFYAVKKPTKGIVEFTNKLGDFKYTPYSNINGVDTFYFSKGHSNKLNLDTGRVILNIISINNAPIVRY